MQQSLIFDTEVDDCAVVALAVAYAYGYDSLEQVVEASGAGEEGEFEEGEAQVAGTLYPAGWSVPKMRRYVKALKPTAQRVLRAIAENAPEADVDAVQEASGIDGYQYAGSMSSFGFAARNTWGVKDKPFAKVGRKYEMSVEVAKLALTVLDELGIK